MQRKNIETNKVSTQSTFWVSGWAAAATPRQLVSQSHCLILNCINVLTFSIFSNAYGERVTNGGQHD